jgi:hypothetical protein
MKSLISAIFAFVGNHYPALRNGFFLTISPPSVIIRTSLPLNHPTNRDGTFAIISKTVGGSKLPFSISVMLPLSRSNDGDRANATGMDNATFRRSIDRTGERNDGTIGRSLKCRRHDWHNQALKKEPMNLRGCQKDGQNCPESEKSKISSKSER